MIMTLAKFTQILGPKITAVFYTFYLVGKFGLNGAQNELARQKAELNRKLIWLYQKEIGILQRERDLLIREAKGEIINGPYIKIGKTPKLELKALAIADLIKHKSLGVVSFQPELGEFFEDSKIPVRDLNFKKHYVDLDDCCWPQGDEGENYWSTVNKNREGGLNVKM